MVLIHLTIEANTYTNAMRCLNRPTHPINKGVNELLNTV